LISSAFAANGSSGNLRLAWTAHEELQADPWQGLIGVSGQ